MRTKDMPPNFSTLLLEKYRNYGESVQHKTAFQYFAGRILPAVNTNVTKYDKLKYSKTITERFIYTDEAFALMLVVNYEARWVSQYDAAVRLGGGKIMKDQSRHWVDARFTSAMVGSRWGVSWSKEGLLKFNSLAKMVKLQRESEVTGTDVEEDLRNWFRVQAAMSLLNKEGGVVHQASVEEEENENEVEALGECGILSL
jgi:hypothetical protein